VKARLKNNLAFKQAIEHRPLQTSQIVKRTSNIELKSSYGADFSNSQANSYSRGKLNNIPQRSKYSVGKVSSSMGLNETRNMPLNINNLRPNTSINFYELAKNLDKTQGSKAAKVIIDS
jgi:hypothetical protein